MFILQYIVLLDNKIFFYSLLGILVICRFRQLSITIKKRNKTNKHQIMRVHEAYNFVLNEYKITAKSISDVTAILETDISKFRNGKRNIGSDLLQQLVTALPPQAKAHFLILFSHASEPPDKIAN